MTALPLVWACTGALAAACTYTLGAQALYRGFGHAVRFAGPSGERFALTFDDGPLPESSLAIAGILERVGDAKGTFFVLGERVLRHPDVARELARRGHELALHGFHHRHLWLQGPGGTKRQMAAGLDAIESVTGVRPGYYRPPWGHFNLSTVRAARQLGLQVVLWSAAPRDWRRIDAGTLKVEIERAIRPGAIVDLHDGGPPGRAAPLVEALPGALEAARALGLRGVVVSELLGGE